MSLALLSGCASRSGGGGYYKDDGPGAGVPPDIAAIPDATPRIETHRPANFRPYSVFGLRYIPIGENQPYHEQGIASWYGRKFHGQRTANGETYDMYAMTAAHPTLPLPSYAQVTSMVNGRSVVVRINDRGPFHSDRIIDLSYVAAAKLGLIGPGSGPVTVRAITNNDIRAGNYPGAPTMVRAEPIAPAPASSSAARSIPVAHRSPAPEQPAETVPRAVPAPASNRNGIYLQFGAFASADNAQALAERILTVSGHEASVSQDGDWYRVRMGPYGSRSLADQKAAELEQAADLRPVIAFEQNI